MGSVNIIKPLSAVHFLSSNMVNWPQLRKNFLWKFLAMPEPKVVAAGSGSKKAVLQRCPFYLKVFLGWMIFNEMWLMGFKYQVGQLVANFREHLDFVAERNFFFEAHKSCHRSVFEERMNADGAYLSECTCMNKLCYSVSSSIHMSRFLM